MVEMTPRERQRYKNSMHRKLVETAREKGIAVSQAGNRRELKKERDIVRPFVYAAKLLAGQLPNDYTRIADDMV